MSSKAEQMIADLLMTVRYYESDVPADLELEELHEVAEQMMNALAVVRRQQLDRIEASSVVAH